MNLYKEVLDSIPTAAIVVDGAMRVRYTNRAFRTYFKSRAARGSLKETTGCREEEVCGEGVKCAYCPMRTLFADAMKGNGTAFRNLIVRGEGGNLSFRIKVSPLGKYYLGVVDNAYETEIAREMYSAQDIQQRLLPPAHTNGGAR